MFDVVVAENIAVENDENDEPMTQEQLSKKTQGLSSQDGVGGAGRDEV